MTGRMVRDVALAAAMCSQTAYAQARPIVLKPTESRHDSAFSGITSARVLSDRRVLIAEFDTRRLAVLDFRTNTVRQIGRRGQGPGEYATTPQLFPLAGDSTLASIRTQRRWLILSSDQIVATIPPTDSHLVKTRADVKAANAAQLLFLKTRAPGADGVVDSADVFLLSRVSGRVDSIARISVAPVRVGTSRDTEGRVAERSEVVGVIRASETPVLFSDGWVALVRLNPPRIDWRRSDGHWIRGEPLPIGEVKLDARQRSWYLRQNPLSGDRIAESVVWPPTIPLFRGNAFATPDGRLIAQR
jgi:hypothetical protein